jgi:hypothetical protein
MLYWASLLAGKDMRSGSHHTEKAKEINRQKHLGKTLSEETLRKMSEAQKGRTHSEETRRKMSEAQRGEKHHFFGKHPSEETREKLRISSKNRPPITDVTRQRISKSLEGRKLTEESRHKISVSMKGKNAGERNFFYGKHHTEESRKKISESQKRRAPISEETLLRMSVAQRGKIKTEEHRRKIGDSKKGKPRSEETREKLRILNTGKTSSEETRIKLSENGLGGHWYGNVRYPEGKQYCELWDAFLRMRIREYWGNKSVISKKTREENGKRKRQLSCHHVYYQEKACCIWDEDVGGYYAWIDGQKHYIDGDPNKFVLLTAGENTMVNTNKLEWVKYFEDLIKKHGGKCYYTKEEWKIIQKNLPYKK